MAVSNPTSPQSVPTHAPEWRTRFVLSAKAHQPKMRLFCRAPDDTAAAMVNECCAALDAGAVPTLVDDGLGGTYFIDDRHGTPRCVFKPRDEEPFAPNNPKRERADRMVHMGETGLKTGIIVGEAALNEQAAYLLDSTSRSGHFCRVPATAIVLTEHSNFYDVTSGEGSTGNEANHAPFRSLKTKVGSLQRFESHVGCADDFSYSLFSIEDVQRIALLDLRIFNLDRHGANLLVQRPWQTSRPSQKLPVATSLFPPVQEDVQWNRPSSTCKRGLEQHASFFLDEWGDGRGDVRSERRSACSLAEQGKESVADGVPACAAPAPGYHLVPIDHGFSLPATITVPYFEWQHWPQVREPMTQQVKDYISRMDPQADATLLRNAVRSGSGLEVREGCLRTMLVCAILLQEGMLAGVSLGDIADLMCEPVPQDAEASQGCEIGRIQIPSVPPAAVETRSPQTVIVDPSLSMSMSEKDFELSKQPLPMRTVAESVRPHLAVNSAADVEMDVNPLDTESRGTALRTNTPPAVPVCRTGSHDSSLEGMDVDAVAEGSFQFVQCSSGAQQHEEVTALQRMVADAEADARAAAIAQDFVHTELAKDPSYVPLPSAKQRHFASQPRRLPLDLTSPSPFESGERLWQQSSLLLSNTAPTARPDASSWQAKPSTDASCSRDSLFLDALRKRVAAYMKSLPRA